jgi:hypothetical protein
MLQASRDAADRPVARPLSRTVFLRLDAEISLDSGSAATGDPGRLPRPDFHRLAGVSLSLGYVCVPPFNELAPELLDAHIRPKIGNSVRLQATTTGSGWSSNGNGTSNRRRISPAS